LTRSASKVMKRGKRISNLILCIGRMLCLSTLLANICLGGPKQQSFHLYQLKPGGTGAAALSPDGSRVAAKDIERVGGESSGKWFDVLQIWDFRSGKLSFERKLNFWDVSSGDRRLIVQSGFPRSLAYTPDGRQLVYCDGTAVKIFDTSEYREIRAFPVTPATPEGPLWEVHRMSVSHDGSEVAVAESELDTKFWTTSGILVSVYSLTSGTLEHTWKFETALSSSALGLAWSPNGKRLALTLIPNDGVADGPQVSRDSFPDLRVANLGLETDIMEINTGHSAGDVAFVGDDAVVAVSGTAAFGSGRKDSLRLWDIQKGKLVREIPSPPDGAHYHLQVSQDGKVVLGYIGKDHRNENFVDTAEQRFRLWDTSSWDVVFTSPPIPDPLDARDIRFALSPDGNLILVWWRSVKGPIYVYERQ
jgi:WD40 repeat protein